MKRPVSRDNPGILAHLAKEFGITPAPGEPPCPGTGTWIEFRENIAGCGTPLEGMTPVLPKGVYSIHGRSWSHDCGSAHLCLEPISFQDGKPVFDKEYYEFVVLEAGESIDWRAASRPQQAQRKAA